MGSSVSSPVHVVCRWAGRSAASGPIPDAGQAVHSKQGKLPSGRYDNVFMLEIEGGTEFQPLLFYCEFKLCGTRRFLVCFLNNVRSCDGGYLNILGFISHILDL